VSVSASSVARWCQIWQLLPKITVFQNICQLLGNIYVKLLPFLEISIVNIDKTIHFGLLTKLVPKFQRENTAQH